LSGRPYSVQRIAFMVLSVGGKLFAYENTMNLPEFRAILPFKAGNG